VLRQRQRPAQGHVAQTRSNSVVAVEGEKGHMEEFSSSRCAPGLGRNC